MSAAATDPEFSLNTDGIQGRLMRQISILFGLLFVFLIWASFVPLATTLHSSGSLSSTAPGYEVQHPLGGRIARVLVAPLDSVTKDQLLIELDVRREIAQLAELRRELALSETETSEISAVLDALTAGHPPPQGATGSFWLGYERFLSEQKSAMAGIDALRDQEGFAQTELDALEQKQQSLAARDARGASLAQKGLATTSMRDQIHEARLEADGEVTSGRAKLTQTGHEIRRQVLEMKLKEAQFREKLTATRAQNERRQPGLRREIIQLEDRVSQAEVRAPAAGIVAKLEYNSTRMFAPQGGTLLTISQPLKTAQIEFDISPFQIDQVHIGMHGILTIPSLPQRSMPTLRVEITSLSPIASRDETGKPVSYRGRAQLLPEDQMKLAKLTETGTRLVSDMPVSISFAGRETTFADYLIKPFIAGLSSAMQD